MGLRRQVTIEQSTESPSHLPCWANEGAVFIEKLVQTGIWTQIEEKVQVARPGGFVGIDVVLFFILFFTANRPGGLKRFGDDIQRYQALLASLGHRKSLPTPSSVSRFLSQVTMSSMSKWATWLLLEACKAKELMLHPASVTYDTHGHSCHFFDWDATKKVIRHRALPEEGERPAAQRLSKELAEPGYVGRKRGDVVYSRAMLQHSGTGLWLDMVSRPCRADTAEFLPSALSTIQDTCIYLGVPLEQAVIRADGCGGNVPWISLCQKSGIHYITRSAHYALLKRSEIQQIMSEATWYKVRSSSGPQRWSADLGNDYLPT